jgi:porphobilinogen synthase
MYPQQRLQRYRYTKSIRDLVTENRLHPSQFILPLFINEGIHSPQPIPSLPGVKQHTLNSMIDEVSAAIQVGIKAVILFGIPQSKDPHAHAAYDQQGIVQQAITRLKKQFSDLIIIADCCLCEYTSHGHCGIMAMSPNAQSAQLDHNATLDTLQKIAVSYANAGVDIIAPSGMMDGMVHAIRTALDTHKADHVSIMSYAIKYASHFYGPFREAAGSDQFTGDRHHHQLNPTQRKEGLREAGLDEQEGADFLMVKPAGFYMDIIRDLSERTHLPIVGYHVSGEYALIHHAATAGSVRLIPALLEVYMGIHRAGAQLIISYAATEIAEYLEL